MSRQYRVIAGPYRFAKRYAERMGWAEDDFVIVTRAHQLARMDPSMITGIVMVGLHVFSDKIKEEIQQEIEMMKALWPVPMVAA